MACLSTRVWFWLVTPQIYIYVIEAKLQWVWGHTYEKAACASSNVSAVLQPSSEYEHARNRQLLMAIALTLYRKWRLKKANLPQYMTAKTHFEAFALSSMVKKKKKKCKKPYCEHVAYTP